MPIEDTALLVSILGMVSWLVKKVYYLNHKVTIVDMILTYTNPEYAQMRNNIKKGGNNNGKDE